MKFDENLAAIHAYLCGDGYVTRNKPGQVKYYHIGFRNTNLVLLKNFQKRFYDYFKIKPNLYAGERCHKGSREIYEKLTSEFVSFYSRRWRMPELNNKLSKVWLRAFFDCEGWVFCKTHQNRHIGLDSVNEKGLDQIRRSLSSFGIDTIKKVNQKRGMFRILIYGKQNLERFGKEIGFLHPNKKETLEKAILDYVDYNWNLDENFREIRRVMIEKARVKKPYVVRVISREKRNLENLRKFLSSLFGLEFGAVKINERINGLGTRYFELSVNKREEVKKLVRRNLINGDQLRRITWGRNERKSKED